MYKHLKNWLIRREYVKTARFLSSVSSKSLRSHSDNRLLKAFHRAAKKMPAYKKLLAKNRVNPSKITTIEQFRQNVPIINKQIFLTNKLSDLCVGGTNDIAEFHTSSGRTGKFSYGVLTKNNINQAALGIEYLLDYNFDIFNRKTLLVNCNPMGVKIHVRTLAVANTGVRSDVAISLIKELSGDFDQFILSGENPFIKKLIEDGIDSGINWNDIIVHAIVGGEFIPENYRSYIEYLLGIDPFRPKTGMVGFTMGLSELSLGIFNENQDTIRTRRHAQKDPELRYALFGNGVDVCPELMQYNPIKTYIESVPNKLGIPELVVSMLDPDIKIPLMRYNTGDVVDIMEFEDLRSILIKNGNDLDIPTLQLPVGIVYGSYPVKQVVSQVEVKEAIYRDFGVASKLTASFRIERKIDKATILIQCKPGVDEFESIRKSIADNLSLFTDADFEIRLVEYKEFAHGQRYNRKNIYEE